VAQPDPIKPPGERYVAQRWIPERWVNWAHDSNKILMEHGRVDGSSTYPKRHQARWRAQHLIGLMESLNLHRRWELSERTWKTDDGRWAWAVEYRGRHGET
jgi:hypothetical protein